MPLYIVAKAVSVLCDVCKQDSISWDNTEREGHIWAGWGVVVVVVVVVEVVEVAVVEVEVVWAGSEVTQDMCDHLQSSFAGTETQIFHFAKTFLH